MISNEKKIFDTISTQLRKQREDIFITGVEITDTPPRFPAVSIVLKSSAVNANGSTFESVENVVSEEYEVMVHSNLEDQRLAKEEALGILEIINDSVAEMYYMRTYCQPIPSVDSKITRYVARFQNTEVTE